MSSGFSQNMLMVLEMQLYTPLARFHVKGSQGQLWTEVNLDVNNLNLKVNQASTLELNKERR